MSSNPAIEIDNASVAYHHRTAIDQMSLKAVKGEFIGIIGPNGAGKTTALRLVNGLARLTGGRVTVLGLDPYAGGGHEARKRVGYLTQTPRIDPRMPLNVRDTVMAGRAGRLGWLKRAGRADWAAVDAALDAVGAGHLERRPLGMLSGGEYQKVALARVLAQQPDVFLFDEPTAAIDPRAQLALLDLIAKVHLSCGATSLYVTHHVRLEGGHAAMPDCCNRLVMMRHGRVWRDGPREELMDEALLRELYHCCSEAKPMYAAGAY